MDFVSLGALFFLALLAPAFVAGGNVVTTLGDKTPGLVILGVIGAAGVGALLRLTGNAVWNFLWPISPTGGWKRLLHRQDDHDFRTEIAESPDMREYWNIANGLIPGGDPRARGDRVVITAEYLLYSEAPPELREWIRRRHTRFSDALSAGAAIALGIVCSWFFPGQDMLFAFGLDVPLVLVAAATWLFAYESRREAQAMERYWYKVRADKKLPRPMTHLAFEPKTELVVRPRLALRGRRKRLT